MAANDCDRAVLPRHGTPLGEQCRQHQEQVVLRHKRSRSGGWRQRRADRPGRPLRRLGSLRQGRQSQVRLQPVGHPGLCHRGRLANPGRHPPGPHGVRYEGGGIGTGGDVTLYYDGDPMGTGRVEATSRSSSRPTRRPTSATRPALRCHPTTRLPRASSPARSTGCRSTSVTTITTTSSIPRSGCASRWPGRSPVLNSLTKGWRPAPLGRPARVRGGATGSLFWARARVWPRRRPGRAARSGAPEDRRSLRAARR